MFRYLMLSAYLIAIAIGVSLGVLQATLAE